MDGNLSPTNLEYYEDMFKLQSYATLLSSFLNEDGRQTLVLDSTIFHPQGGGQPSDKGSISNPLFKFIVEDVRSKDKIVYHYGHFEDSRKDENIEKGAQVLLTVDEGRRKLNSRLHSAGHLLDICVRNVGWDHLEPGKAYHFPDGPFVEYKGEVPHNELKSKPKELELEASKLISKGGKVSVSILPYDKASELCGGSLPDYIPKDSAPRIVQLGDSLGCPCGGTHVNDISEILNLKVTSLMKSTISRFLVTAIAAAVTRGIGITHMALHYTRDHVFYCLDFLFVALRWMHRVLHEIYLFLRHSCIFFFVQLHRQFNEAKLLNTAFLSICVKNRHRIAIIRALLAAVYGTTFLSQDSQEFASKMRAANWARRPFTK
ncbi:UNVERIFIED_CONTAM: Alanyl-tRNA editing protein AlaX-L [Sesamum indicum]